jgi:hypothetical protein
MLVNINEDVLQLLELDDLKDTEANKILVENVVNSYMVGGIFTAIQQGACDIDKEVIEAFMDHYARKMLLHSIKMMLERQ